MDDAWRVVVAGYSIEAWLRLWEQCHNWVMGCPVRIGWPDDGATLNQPAIAVRMFELITLAQVKEAAKRGNK